MAQPYVGEVRLFAGNFAPAGWMFCDGTLLPISENETLFNLIGTTYGGDGQETFGLPDLRGRIPIHQGTLGINSYQLAQMGGVETVTLTTQQIPAHTHALSGSTDNANQTTAGGNILAQVPTYTPYVQLTAGTALAANAISPAGTSQPHSNMQPYLGINFIISLFGIFPSQT